MLASMLIIMFTILRMGNRTLIEPAQLFEIFKEKEEYKQQCLALEQRLKDKEEIIQHYKL